MFNVNIHTENAKPYFEVETNLPDDMQFMFTVRDGDGIVGQDNSQVTSGSITAGPFSRKGDSYPPGEYQLSITSPLLHIQSSQVQYLMGENGENFYGDYISNGRVDFETTFIVDGDLEEVERSKEAELAFLQEHLIYLNDKLDLLEQAKEKDQLEWASWSREWNIDLQQHNAVFNQELGANLNEYKGYCRNAFLDVVIAYGEIFILWMDYDSFVEGDMGETELNVKKSDFISRLDEAQANIAACQER